MATAYKCDRCKKHFDGRPLTQVSITVNTSVHQNYYDKVENAEGELCCACSRAVYDGLTATPPEEEP